MGNTTALLEREPVWPPDKITQQRPTQHKHLTDENALIYMLMVVIASPAMVAMGTTVLALTMLTLSIAMMLVAYHLAMRQAKAAAALR